MPELAGPQIRDVLTTRMAQPVSDPPTASEEWARIQIVKLLWVLYEEDPDSIGPPGTEPRDVWGMMYGAPHDEMIAAGVAAMWP